MKERDKMDELEKNIPNDFWRKAFDEAAETPPPRVWDSIERQLNESNETKIIPLWGFGLVSSRPFVWGTGIAAALALLITGWWAIDTQPVQSSAARIQTSSPTGNVAQLPATPNKLSGRQLTGQTADVVTSINKPLSTLSPSGNVSTNSLSGTRSVKDLGNKSVAQIVAKTSPESGSLNGRTMEPIMPGTPSAAVAINVPTPVSNRIPVASFTSDRNVATDLLGLKQPELVAYNQLRGKSLRLRSLGPIQRIVWFQTAELPIEAGFTKQKRKTREKWASASVMPGAFNPMVSVPSAQVGLANTSVAGTAKTNASAISSRANISMAYQASAGIQLTERWSVESGVGYLEGHSTVESSAQTVAYNSGQGISADRITVTTNLYVDALRNSSSPKLASNITPTSADFLANTNAYLSQGTYNSQTRETLTNDYQYVQVPLQVGYQLRPRKRLSLAVLGGLLTNIFVRNTVGNGVVVTGKDGVYRPVSLAATMGARFRYRPSGRWSASLAGVYQPSLESGNRADSQVQSHPTSAGMSFGVDYHF